MDHIVACPELRSVDFTAALNDDSLLRAVDATEASLLEAELRAVLVTAAPATSVT